MTNLFMFYSNKDHVEEMKRVNDEKLAELNTKLEDCESTLKSHRRELSVCDNFRSRRSLLVDQKNQTYSILFWYIGVLLVDLQQHP